jgi:hypothetical protein
VTGQNSQKYRQDIAAPEYSRTHRLSTVKISSLADGIRGCTWILVLRDAALPAPGADGWDLGIVALLLRAVGPWGQLDEGVQRDGHPWGVGLGLLHEVGVDAAQDGLVGHDEDVL